jgi:hypothetical protein
MKHIKSERLKKLEAELQDLDQWLKLGLVPKKDIEKHKEEIQNLFAKIEEEKERLQFLKESGEGEEYIAPKRTSQTRAGYSEMPTIPDIEAGENTAGFSETGFDMESEMMEAESSAFEEGAEHGSQGEEEEEGEEGEEKDDDDTYFSDRNRWKRGGILDPDADNW